MAETSLGFFYDFLGLNNLKVFYDFTSLSGSYINSSAPALSIHSGLLNGVGVTNDSGTLPFNSSIRISNIDNTFQGLGTHIFNFERTGDLGSGLLFSSLQTGALTSGYNIGLTDSNLLFFEYSGANGPVVVNSDIILGDKNAVAVLVGNNNVSFNYYNFNTKQFEVNTRTINSSHLLFSNQWELRGVDNLLGNYLYFNSTVPTNNLTRLFSGFYSTPTSFPEVTGYETYFEQVGYDPPTGYFGEGSFRTNFSGFDSDLYKLLNGQFGDPVFWGEVTDLSLISGGEPFPASGLPSGFYGVVVTGGTGDFTGDYFPFYYGAIEQPYLFSGGQNIPYEGAISGSFVIFDNSINSCPTSPVFDIDEIPISGTPFILNPVLIERTGDIIVTPAYSGYLVDSGVVESYGMSQLSYLWGRDSDNIETLLFTGGIPTPYLRRNCLFDLVKGEFSAGGFLQSGNSNFFLNGLFQVESGFTESGNIFEPVKLKMADYFIEDQYFNTNGAASSLDLAIYDFNQQQNRSIIPNLYSGNDLISGSSYDFNNKSVYLNGQRLVSGIDYTYDGTDFTVDSSITGIEGVLCLVNNYTGEYRLTGQYDYTGDGPRFSRDSSIQFLNGVRLNRLLRAEHSNFDLIGSDFIHDDSSLPILNSNDTIF